ncbi:MAG TPA: kynureninase [Bacteroidetes bacterium]|nr:kynureninase [Bacteroidota bacterium]
MRNNYHIPKDSQGRELIYFAGHSLGLQPKTVRHMLDRELNQWASSGVEGHFDTENAWYTYHERMREPLGKLIGGKTHEVAALNSLTVNLNLLLTTFYRPTKRRYKILVEEHLFASDYYAIEQQVKLHGLSAKECIEFIPWPKENKGFSLEIIKHTIDKLGESLALILLPGVQYINGQCFPIQAIVESGHNVGALVGFDLAHAIGNVDMKLHEWQVDFACWCSYKYLNSGPGGPGGIFVHENHLSKDLPQMAGWWGNDPDERFTMEKAFIPVSNADRFQMSNPSILALAAHEAALAEFDKTTIRDLRKEAKRLTNLALKGFENLDIHVITPIEWNRRGNQLSIELNNAMEVHKALREEGIVCDLRDKNILRLAFCPMYNKPEEIALLLERLENLMK